MQRRAKRQEELSDIVRDVKQLAVSFNNGKSVAVLAASQIGRTEYNYALKSGEYSIASFSDTSEMERSADLLVWLLRRKQDKEAHEIKAGICKYRDGSVSIPFTLYEDYAHGLIADLRRESQI